MDCFVIDCFWFVSGEDVQSRVLFCDPSGTLSRMSEEDADAFYRAYDVGIEHTSEILRSKGLW
jgi:hypothetical protein